LSTIVTRRGPRGGRFAPGDYGIQAIGPEDQHELCLSGRCWVFQPHRSRLIEANCSAAAFVIITWTGGFPGAYPVGQAELKGAELPSSDLSRSNTGLPSPPARCVAALQRSSPLGAVICFGNGASALRQGRVTRRALTAILNRP